MLVKLSLVSIVLSAAVAHAANILILSSLPTFSHHYWNGILGEALGAREHNVTIFSPYFVKQPPKNVHYIHIENTTNHFEEYGKRISGMTDKSNPFVEFIHLAQLSREMCSEVLKSQGFQTLLKYPSNSFDLIVHDFSGGPCIVPFVHKFQNPPLVIATPYSIPSFITHVMGGHQFYSYMPHILLSYDTKMDFWQRLTNFFIHVQEFFLRQNLLMPELDDATAEYFGPNYPSISEMERRTILALVNTNPVMDYPAPLQESIIPVGGLHIKETKPLSNDLENYFNSTTKGVVLFSLGSNLRSDNIPISKQQLFINVFREFRDYNFLWKFEGNISDDDLPKNVRIHSWLPQSDILAHPKLKAFITHGGLLSAQESIWYGVPLVVIPFALDQHMNMNKLKKIGIAEDLDFFSLSHNSIKGQLSKVLENPKYSVTASRLRNKFRDQKETPLERAIWWLEWAIRNPDCDQMKSPVLELGYVVGNSFDIIAFVTLLLAAILLLTMKICYSLLSKINFRNNSIVRLFNSEVKKKIN